MPMRQNQSHISEVPSTSCLLPIADYSNFFLQFLHTMAVTRSQWQAQRPQTRSGQATRRPPPPALPLPGRKRRADGLAPPAKRMKLASGLAATTAVPSQPAEAQQQQQEPLPPPPPPPYIPAPVPSPTSVLPLRSGESLRAPPPAVERAAAQYTLSNQRMALHYKTNRYNDGPGWHGSPRLVITSQDVPDEKKCYEQAEASWHAMDNRRRFELNNGIIRSPAYWLGERYRRKPQEPLQRRWRLIYAAVVREYLAKNGSNPPAWKNSELWGRNGPWKSFYADGSWSHVGENRSECRNSAATETCACGERRPKHD